MQTITLDLSDAAVNQRIELAGSAFRVVAASSSAAVISVGTSQNVAELLPCGPGYGARLTGFNRLFASWPAQSGVTVTLAVYGEVNYQGPEDVFISTKPASPSMALDFQETTDLHNGTTLTPNVYNAVCTNKAFTLTSPSKCVVSVNCGFMVTAAAGSNVGLHIRVDGVRYQCSYQVASGGLDLAFAGGTVPVDLASGSHTVALDIVPMFSTFVMNLRALTFPEIESLRIRVLVLTG